MFKSINPFEFFSANAKNMGVDHEKHIDNHRKNMESMAQAHKSALEVMRNVSQMQQKHMQQAFESMAIMIKNLSQKGHTQETWQQHGESLKKHMSNSIDHSMQVASTLSKVHKDASESVKSKMAEHMKSVSEKMKDMGKKAEKAH